MRFSVGFYRALKLVRLAFRVIEVKHMYILVIVYELRAAPGLARLVVLLRWLILESIQQWTVAVRRTAPPTLGREFVRPGMVPCRQRNARYLQTNFRRIIYRLLIIY